MAASFARRALLTFALLYCAVGATAAVNLPEATGVVRLRVVLHADGTGSQVATSTSTTSPGNTAWD